MNKIIELPYSSHFNFKKVESRDYCDLYIDEAQNVVFIKITKDVYYTLEIAKSLFYKYCTYFPENKIHVVINTTEKSKLEDGVLDFGSSVERSNKIISDAIVVKTATHKFAANFYLRIKNPKIKTKFFDELLQAFDWTAEQIIINKK